MFYLNFSTLKYKDKKYFVVSCISDIKLNPYSTTAYNCHMRACARVCVTAKASNVEIKKTFEYNRSADQLASFTCMLACHNIIQYELFTLHHHVFTWPFKPVRFKAAVLTRKTTAANIS